MDIEKPTYQIPHKAPAQIIQNLARDKAHNIFVHFHSSNYYDSKTETEAVNRDKRGPFILDVSHKVS